MKRKLPSAVVSIVALSCVGLFLQGCYLCPYEDAPYEFALFNSYKIGQQIQKNTWFSLGTHIFDQNVQYEGGLVKLNSAVQTLPMKTLKSTIRVTHRNSNNQLMNRWNFKPRWKMNGNQKKPVKKTVPISFFSRGDWIQVEAKFNKHVPEQTLFAYDFVMTF